MIDFNINELKCNLKNNPSCTLSSGLALQLIDLLQAAQAKILTYGDKMLEHESTIMTQMDEIEGLRSKLDDLEKQEPIGYYRIDSFSDNLIYDNKKDHPNYRTLYAKPKPADQLTNEDK